MQPYYNPKQQEPGLSSYFEVLDDARFALEQLNRKSSQEDVCYPDKYFNRVFEDQRSKRKNQQK